MLRLSPLWPLIAFVAGCMALGGAQAIAQAKPEIVIARKPSILYLPAHIMEKQHLIEKHAEHLGLPNLKVTWSEPNGRGTQTAALLAGGVDISGAGVGNLLLLWDRSKGGVQGIVAISALPEMLISRNPNINSLKDFGPADKIAVPTIKISTQALLLQIASAKMFGDNNWNKLEGNVVQLGHADAAAALANPQSEVATHFSAPLFQFDELKNVPGAHPVVTSAEIVDGPLTQSLLFTTARFAEANPVVIEAVKAAALEAEHFIHENAPAAIETYREVTGDKTSADEILDMLKQPGMMEFNPQPQGVMRLAEHMYRTRILKAKPQAWTDAFLPAAHDLPGN